MPESSPRDTRSPDSPTLAVKCLASGSTGNALLVRAGATTLLIDCGISARAAGKHLTDRGIDPASVAAIVLTHEHHDHAIGAGAFARKHGSRVVANQATLDAAKGLLGETPNQPLAVGSALTIGDCEIVSFPVPHDAAAPVGYLVRSRGWTVAVCIDLGAPDESLLAPLAEADLLVIEANHDYDKLRFGPYAPMVKERLLSPLGHLSNLEAARLIAGSQTARPRTVWLAHLSIENNSPRLARRIVGGALRRDGVTGVRLQVAERDRPSLSWSADEVGWQLPLGESFADLTDAPALLPYPRA